MGVVGAFKQSSPLFSGVGALGNKRNWTDPKFAFNPMKSGSIANAGLNVIAPGMGFLMGGKGGGEKGTAYATGEFDIPSANARRFLEDYLKTSTSEQKRAFQEQVARGIENREAVKKMENARLAGPHLQATSVKALPQFLTGSSPQLVSGADRGTLHGAALQDAIGRGESSVPRIEVPLGAKGTPTGIAAESIPKFAPTNFQILTPADQLHAGAQMAANQMNQPKGAK